MSFFLPQLGERVAADDPDEPADRGPNRVQIEDQYERKVKQYDELMKQKRFDEAIIAAKQAHLVQPENLTTFQFMALNAKVAKQEDLSVAQHLIDRVVVGEDQVPRQMQARIAHGAMVQLVFGQALDADAARTRFGARLASKVASIDRICQLTDAQKQRLELAGRGDIKRFFDRIDSLQPPFQGHGVLDDKEFREWSSRLSVEAIMLRRILKAGVFEDGSLFAKTLKTTLSADQAAAYAAAPPTPLEGSLVRWVDPVAKKVWIGLGEADGVQPRTIYRVHKKPQAQRRPGEPQADRANEWIKGTIEVTRVLEENLCEARIVDEDVANPIAKGDPIAPQHPKAR
jgi:hypothetical protein